MASARFPMPGIEDALREENIISGKLSGERDGQQEVGSPTAMLASFPVEFVDLIRHRRETMLLRQILALGVSLSVKEKKRKQLSKTLGQVAGRWVIGRSRQFPLSAGLAYQLAAAKTGLERALGRLAELQAGDVAKLDQHREPLEQIIDSHKAWLTSLKDLNSTAQIEALRTEKTLILEAESSLVGVIRRVVNPLTEFSADPEAAELAADNWAALRVRLEARGCPEENCRKRPATDQPSGERPPKVARTS